MRPTPSRIPNQDQLRGRDVVNAEFQVRGPGMKQAKKPVEDINSVRELFAGFVSTMIALAPSRREKD